MSDLVSDLRHAARALARQPGFTAAAVLLLGIGIGATSVIGTLVRATFGKHPPHVEAPSRLVRVTRTSQDVFAGALGYPDYAFLRDENRTLAGLAAYDRSLISVMARAAETTEQVQTGLVSGEYFAVLGVRPTLGRLLHPDDDRGVGGPRVAVISHELWSRWFAGRPDAIGARVMLGAEPFDVVGVAPEGFRGATLSEATPDIWVPLTLQPILGRGEGNRFERVPDQSEFWLDAVGRLSPGVTAEAATADLTALATRMEREFAAWNEGVGVRVSTDVRYQPNLRRRVVRTMNLLAAVTATILVIACANVALLLLARGASRAREMGIRQSLGAGRARIVRQLLAESILLAALGSAAGMVLAMWASGPVGAALLTGVDSRFQPDAVVAGLTALVAVGAVLLFGLAPALTSTSAGVAELIKTGTAGARRGSRLRAALVVSQVALSLSLVTGATLLVRSVLAAHAVELGFGTDRRLLLGIDLERQGYTEARGKAFLREITARLSALPGVETATLTRQVPFRGMWSTGFLAEGVTPPSGGAFESGANAVGPGYFATMAIPVVAGREFTLSDDELGQRVAVVNQTLARQVWGDADPLGRVIGEGGEIRFTVVGVVRDARYYDLSEAPQAQLYLTPLQFYRPALNVLVRTGGDPANATGAIVRAMRDLEPALVVGAVRTLGEVVSAELRPYRTLAVTLAAVAGVALLLAALGLYGVLAYLVTQRTREFGIRLALGAYGARITRDVVWQGVRLAGVGIIAGAATAWIAVRLVSGFLFQIDMHDPIALAVAPLALAAAALAASFLPARRAGGIPPMEALRHD